MQINSHNLKRFLSMPSDMFWSRPESRNVHCCRFFCRGLCRIYAVVCNNATHEFHDFNWVVLRRHGQYFGQICMQLCHCSLCHTDLGILRLGFSGILVILLQNICSDKYYKILYM